jgi:coenzyme F420 biosynthesis associated uncharacterized protein
MDAATVDWSMGSRAARLADWSVAREVGRRVAGPGARVQAAERARMREDLARVVDLSTSLVREHTGLAGDGVRARAWVMSRGEWIGANLRGLQRLLEPLAERLDTGNRSELRRKALGAQFGVLLGYVSRKVLGQVDVFLPPDDEGLVYFIGPNVAEAERRFHLPSDDFRLWISLHEVTHLVQFGAAPWLRSTLGELIDTYLGTVQLDPKELLAQLRRAAAEARAGAEWRGAGAFFLMLTPEQREIFHRMQSIMSLLEGHASYVMNEAARDRVRDLERMRAVLRARRRATPLERSFQRAIGFESKVKQYDAGERFVRAVVEGRGMAAMNLVWADRANLPSTAEIADPDAWLSRVAGA